jgi:L-aminopeptidase/D-esterase-like protein
VGALAAVNAWGDIRPVDASAHDDAPLRIPPPLRTAEASFANTTLGVIVTNARLTKSSCWLVAGSGHDGMARALDPVHSTADGDTLVAAATGEVEAPIEAVRALAAAAVERAIRSATPPA